MTSANAQWLTLAFMLGITVIVIVYDVAIIHAVGTGPSISRVCRQISGCYPTLFVAAVFWLGVLAGHIGIPCE